ncbi:MAG TPA: hypothetical protein VF624_12125 [Tepidisphaeraceae bacterium]|jgi:hypothetical protein
MLRQSIFATALALGLLAPLTPPPALAEEMGDDAKPAEKKETEKADKADKPKKTIKLSGLWAKLTDVTDEQKAKISALHRKALADKRQIEEQEEIDILATLTDEQKKQYETLKEEDASKRKETAAKRKTDTEKPAEEKD